MSTYPTYKLGDVADYINGRAFKPKEWKEKGLPIVRIQNLNDENAEYHYSDVMYEEKYLLHNGDLLFAWAASLGTYIWNNGDAWLNQHIFKVIPKENVSKKYLYYALTSIIKELYAKSHGSGMVHVTKDKFINTEIPLPPLHTQHAIVSRIESLFSDLDKGVEHLRTAQQQIKTYRQAVLNHWLNNDDGKWEVVKLGDVIEKPTYGTSKKCDYDIEGTGVLRIPNIGNGCIIDDDLKFAVFSDEEKEKYALKEGDLLTIRSNGSIDLVGKCALISSKEEKYLFAGYLIRLRSFPERVNSKFLTLTLESHNLRIQIEDKAKSTSGVNNINSVEIQNLKISLPPLSEQQRIVAEIESRLSQAEAAEARIAESLQKTEALRQSILKKAFEGELV